MKRILLSILLSVISLSSALALDHPANYKIKNHLKSDSSLLLFNELQVHELDSFLRFSWAFSSEIMALVTDKRIVVKYAISDSLTPVTMLRLGHPWVLAEFGKEENAGLLSNLQCATNYTWNIGVLDSELPLRIVDENKIIWQFPNGKEQTHLFQKKSSLFIISLLAIFSVVVLGVAMKKRKKSMNS